MLFIWDVHITTRHQDMIIDAIKAYIDQHPEEKHIIFVGDYVYHFAYDRGALLALFSLFGDLYRDGKQVYILAGNHDWLADTFVYAEAQKTLDVLGHDGLHMITEPTWYTIEGQEVFFVPYVIDTHALPTPDHKFDYTGTDIQKGQMLSLIAMQGAHLQDSVNKSEQLSGYLNAHLAHQLADKDDVLMIHHYYVANTVFPGQKSRFGFKDVALAEQWLKVPGLRMLSGHIHQPFAIENYMCTGSVWSTSWTEANQLKAFFHYDAQTRKLSGTEVATNPFLRLQLEEGDTLDEQRVHDFYAELQQTMSANMQSPIWDITMQTNPALHLAQASVTIQAPHVDYEQTEQVLDKELQHSLKDVRLVKKSHQLDQLMEQLDLTKKDLAHSWADWKEVLKAHVSNKYGNEKESYYELLRELKVL